MPRRLVVDPLKPDPQAIAAAAAVIRQGGVVAFPTDTLYGLAADPFNAEAVRRVFTVKGREDAQPVALVAADITQVEDQLVSLPATARSLAERFWPGPLTLLLQAPARLARGVVAETGLVGVRVPAHGVSRALAYASDRVLTATSANRSGEPASADPDHVWLAFGDAVDLMLDAGPTRGGAPSTLVDVTAVPPRLVRSGAIAWETIEEWLRTR